MIIIIWALVVIGITIHSIIWLIRDYRWQRRESTVSAGHNGRSSTEYSNDSNINTAIQLGMNSSSIGQAYYTIPPRPKPRPFLEPRLTNAIDRIMRDALERITNP